MLANNNLKICHILAWRDFKFHKAKNLLLAFAVVLITGLYAFTGSDHQRKHTGGRELLGLWLVQYASAERTNLYRHGNCNWAE